MRRSVLGLAVLVGLGLLVLGAGAWVESASFGPRDVPVPKVARARAPRVVPERADDGLAWVRCVAGTDDAGILAARQGADGELLYAEGGPTLQLGLEPGEWRLWWERPDGVLVVLGDVELAAGEVHRCRLVAEGYAVRGVVQDGDGEPVAGAWVAGCGEGATTDVEGRFALTLSGGCELRAWSQDGLLRRPGTSRRVGPFDDGEELVLEVDTRPVAGMGLAFDVEEEGVRVARVHEGTPAEEAGLLAGDLIVRLDGTRTAGMDQVAFVTAGTGEEGSTAVVEVERDGRALTFRFQRRRLADPEVVTYGTAVGDTG